MNARHERDIGEWLGHVASITNQHDLCRGIEIVWNPRMTSRIGDASWLNSKIHLSPTVYVSMKKADRRNAIIQAVAHILCRRLFGRTGHKRDQLWSRMVWSCDGELSDSQDHRAMELR
jgi:predicted SprT family Zn-dependent metalloprotease